LSTSLDAWITAHAAHNTTTTACTFPASTHSAKVVTKLDSGSAVTLQLNLVYFIEIFQQAERGNRDTKTMLTLPLGLAFLDRARVAKAG
jgi:hypothetical protein